MTDDPCRKELNEYIEALLKYSEARAKVGGSLPLATEPLDSSRDIVPVVVTQELLAQWRKAREAEAEAEREFTSKTESLLDCREKHNRSR